MLPTAAPPREDGVIYGSDWNIWLKLDEKQGSKDVRLFVAAYGDKGKTADLPMNPLMLHGATYQYLVETFISRAKHLCLLAYLYNTTIYNLHVKPAIFCNDHYQWRIKGRTDRVTDQRPHEKSDPKC